MNIEKLRLTGEEFIRLGLEPAQLRCRVCALSVADAQLDKALKAVLEHLDGLRCVDSSAIGPLFGSGWNSALEEVQKRLLKAEGQKVKKFRCSSCGRFLAKPRVVKPGNATYVRGVVWCNNSKHGPRGEHVILPFDLSKGQEVAE